MGAVTPIDKVWYPDKTDVDQPDVYMATHSQSIEEGIGARLRQQEVAVGMKGGINPTEGIPRYPAIAPFTIRQENGGFNEGFTLSGGEVTVKVKGLYMVASSVGMNPVSMTPTNRDRTVCITLTKNAEELAGSEVRSDPSYYQNAAATTVISCVPGDRIAVRWYSGATVAGEVKATLANYSALTYLSVALIQALPA